jgi:hypothetical protein
MWNVGQILDAKVVMVAQLQTKLDGLMVEKDLIIPTIKLASTNIEQCQVDLETAMGCMDGMKNDIEQVGDSTLSVVQNALKAKNNGLEKEGRGGVLSKFTKTQVGIHPHLDFEVDYAKVWLCFEHAQGLVSKAEALTFAKKEYFGLMSKFYVIDPKISTNMQILVDARK